MDEKGAESVAVGSAPQAPIKQYRKRRGAKTRQPTMQLRAFRRVGSQVKDEDKGPLEDNLRKLLEADPKGFHSQWAALEREHRSGLKKDREGATAPGAAAAGPEDAGTEKCLQLIEGLLKEKGWEK